MDIQEQIDKISWYHEFDFGNGLVAKDNSSNAPSHRLLWSFIEQNLDSVDFRDKTVLDIGCWDGYWSFFAEKRGAKHVLATDDSSQNWAGDSGFQLARKLLKSKVDADTNMSVYDLTKMDKKFDVILCLGVYYHLIDPFYAFAQIRHCCHENTVVIFEGDALYGISNPAPQSSAFYSSDVTRAPRFVPEPETLKQMLRGNYFQIEEESMHSISGDHGVNRLLVKCSPWVGANAFYPYRPPFGLDKYDTRCDLPPEKWVIESASDAGDTQEQPKLAKRVKSAIGDSVKTAKRKFLS